MLFVEHWMWLRDKRKNALEDEEKKKISDEINEIQQMMLVAQFGDRNVGRFNKWG